MRALWLASLGALASCSGAPTGGGDPEPMPTGTILAGTPNGVQRGTYLIDIASGEVTQIAQAGEPLSVAFQGGYSHALGSVYGSRPAPPPNRIRSLRLGTGDTTTLFQAPSQDDLIGTFALSPDGARLVVQTQDWPSQAIRLSIVRLASGEQNDLVDSNQRIDSLPMASLRWSPDGSKLAAVTDVFPDRSELVSIDLDVPTFRVISGRSPAFGEVDISPDGRVLAHRDGDGVLRFLDWDGGLLSGYPEVLPPVIRPTFSPDGQFLAYQEVSIESGEGDIILMRLSDGKRWPLKIQADVRPWLSDWF